MKNKFLILASTIFAAAAFSSGTSSNRTYVYVTYDAGDGYFNVAGDKLKSVTLPIMYGRTWGARFDEEKPVDPYVPKVEGSAKEYIFDEYFLDGKSILNSYQIKKDITVTASYHLKIDDTPYPKGTFATCDWEVIASASLNGLEDDDITKKTLKWYFANDIKDNNNSFIGLTKTVKLKDLSQKSGQKEYTVRVIGENHDVLADNTGVAALTFEFVDLIPGLAYDSYSQNSNKWSSSYLRNYLNGNEFTKLIVDEGLVKNIKKVTKKSNSGNRAGSNSITKTEDSFFILSLKEMGIDEYPYNKQGEETYNVEEEGELYAYYKNKDNDSRIKKYNNLAYPYWARSPETITYSFSWVINNEGSCGIKDTTYNEISPVEVREAMMVSPCFSLGRTLLNNVEIKMNNQSIVMNKEYSNLLWNDDSFETKLTLNTKQHPYLDQTCDMFTYDVFDDNNFMVVVGLDNSIIDPDNPYKTIVPLNKVSDVKTEAGYSLDAGFNLKLSSPKLINDNILHLDENKYFAFAGIYIVANAKIKDSHSWDTIYNVAKYNKHLINYYYAPGISKDVSINGVDNKIRVIGLNDDEISDAQGSSLGYTAGMSFEVCNPIVDSNKALINIQYGSNNNWNNSNLRNQLNSSILTDLSKSIFGESTSNTFSNVLKKTIVGGSSEITNNKETIFTLSPSELGISQDDYNEQYFHIDVSKYQHAYIINDESNNEGKAYDYYNHTSFYLKNALRYHGNNNIWLRSPDCLGASECFSIDTRLDDPNYNYLGQCMLNSSQDSRCVCPCFAF